MKRIISVIISLTVLFTSVTPAVFSLETGDFGGANGSVEDNLTDLIVPEFNKEYAVIYNDFENVSEYTDADFPISYTGNQAYGNAFTVNRTTSWKAYVPRNSVTYVWNDNNYVMFGEPLEVGQNYILSYDYMSEVTEGKVDGYSFSLAPQHDDFSNGTGDWTHFPLYYTDKKWRTVTHGFTASDSKLNLKVNTCGYNAKSYVDNMLLMKAAEVNIDAPDGTVEIAQPSENLIKAGRTKNGKLMVAKGEALRFKLKLKRGLKVTYVKHGNEEITADADGYYSVSEVTADVRVKAEVDYSDFTAKYYIDESNNIYLPAGSSLFAIADASNIDPLLLAADRGDNTLLPDEELCTEDVLKIVAGEETLATYKVKKIGDVNLDCAVSISDVINVIEFILSYHSSDSEKRLCDVNGSGTVTVSDVVALRKTILSKASAYSDEEIVAKMNTFRENIITASGVNTNLKEINDGIYNLGDRSLITKLLKKAAAGEEITLAFIGGSITEGGTAKYAPSAESGIITTFSGENNNLCDWICKWFEDNFDCKVNKVNAGISATDTIYGIHRLGEDVLIHNPDLVVVEYSVNDTPDLIYKQASYEAIVRKLLGEKIATVMLSMCVKAGYSSQNLHEPISDHYRVPMVSFKDAYFGNSQFQYLYPDSTHPNMVGHPLTALLVTNLLQKCYEDISDITENTNALPKNYVNYEATRYDNPHIADISDIVEGKVDGVTLVDLGSFYVENEKTAFGYRKHTGVTAVYSENYQPLVIKVDSCKSLFVQMLRSNKIADGSFMLEINGETVTSNTFTCSANGSVDNIQPESRYFWSSYSAYSAPDAQEITLKIYPTNTNPDDVVTLYSLLIA